MTAVGAGADETQAYAPRVVTVEGVEVAFVAFTDTFAVPVRHRDLWGAGPQQPGTALLLDRDRVIGAVAEARRLADTRAAGLVVVSMHWGYEYVRHPAPPDRALALAVIEAGADIVVGHHPHVTQGVEVYRDRLILYSLGNLLFDSEKSPDRTVGALVTFSRASPEAPWLAAECRLTALAMDRTRLAACPPGDPGARSALAEIARLSASLGTAAELSDEDELVIALVQEETAGGP